MLLPANARRLFHLLLDNIRQILSLAIPIQR